MQFFIDVFCNPFCFIHILFIIDKSLASVLDALGFFLVSLLIFFYSIPLQWYSVFDQDHLFQKVIHFFISLEIFHVATFIENLIVDFVALITNILIIS